MERAKQINRSLLCVLIIIFVSPLARKESLFAKDGVKLPVAIQEIADRGARTPAEQALLEAAALRYKIPGYPLHEDTKCGIGVTVGLSQYWSSYTQAQKLFLDSLGRPPLNTSIVSPAGLFRIHYDTTGINAPDMTDNNNNGIPDYIEGLAEAADSAYMFEVVDSLKYMPPPRDGTRGGDSLYDIYIVDLSPYGFTFPDNDNPINPNDPTHAARYSASIMMDNDFAPNEPYGTHGLDAARVTIAHEFFHVIQIGDYGLWNPPMVNACDEPNRWFLEMSSVWMENMVYPGIKDYLQYEPDFFSGITNDFQLGITPCGTIQYGMGIFLRYADKKYSWDHSIVHQIWDSIPVSEPLEAMDNAFRARHFSLANAWCEFCTGLLFTNSRANDTLGYFYYNDAKLYPSVSFQKTFSSPPQNLTDSIHVLTSAYYAFSMDTNSHDSLYAVITNTDTGKGFNKDARLQGFTLNIGTGYATPISGTNLTYQFSPNLTDWCVTVTKAGIDQSGVQPPFPNPFIVDGTSQMFFPIKSDVVPKKVELNIYTESGKLAYNTSLVPEVRSGRLGVAWNGQQNYGGDAKSGVYIYVLYVNGNESIGKIALVHR